MHFLHFILILLTQLEIIYSDTGICSQCTDLLNYYQCTSSPLGCYWQSNTCVISTNTVTNSNPPTAISKQRCQDKTQSCDGYDAGNYTQACAYNTNLNCVAVNINLPCSAYNTTKFCLLNDRCFWTAAIGKTKASCNLNVCGDFKLQNQCRYVVTQTHTSAKACKWVMANNKTTGTCVDGIASDLTQNVCQLSFNQFYTFDDATKFCTACTDTANVSYLLQVCALVVSLALIS